MVLSRGNGFLKVWESFSILAPQGLDFQESLGDHSLLSPSLILRLVRRRRQLPPEQVYSVGICITVRFGNQFR